MPIRGTKYQRPPPPTRGTPDVEACILAGGLSHRMGRDKSRVRLDGRTLLDLCHDLPHSLGLPIHVVRRDCVHRCGPLGGVLTALRRCSAPALLFLACDTPFIAPSLAKRILRLWKTRRKPVFTLQQGFVGFPFLLPHTADTLVEQQIAAAVLSLQDLAHQLNALYVHPAPHERASLININNPAILARAKQRPPHRSPSPATSQGVVTAKIKPRPRSKLPTACSKPAPRRKTHATTPRLHS